MLIMTILVLLGTTCLLPVAVDAQNQVNVTLNSSYSIYLASYTVHNNYIVSISTSGDENNHTLQTADDPYMD